MKLSRLNPDGSGASPVRKWTVIFLVILFSLPLTALAQEAQWELKSSSHLPPQGNNYYDVYRIFDGQLGTAWVEGVSGGGVGEFITMKLTSIMGNVGTCIFLTGFEINNGYCKDRDTWLKNGRVKKIKIYRDDTLIYTGHLEDTMNVQTIDIGSRVISLDEVLKIEIVDVFPGTEYEDTAISELVPIFSFTQ